MSRKKNIPDEKTVTDGVSFEDFAKEFLTEVYKSKEYFSANSEKMIDGQKKGDLYSRFIRYTQGAVSKCDSDRITFVKKDDFEDPGDPVIYKSVLRFRRKDGENWKLYSVFFHCELSTNKQ